MNTLTHNVIIVTLAAALSIASTIAITQYYVIEHLRDKSDLLKSENDALIRALNDTCSAYCDYTSDNNE